jgi:predicted DNA-binding transcriptional regulator YafY
MLTDDEALATLLGLMTVQRAGLAATSVASADTATAKLRRVLPQPLGRRLDALLATARFTGPANDAVTSPGGRTLLTLAEAAWDRHPIEMRYSARDESRSQRVVHPYGLVAHSGRWYVTGADSSSGEVRTFRVDRIEHLRALPGSFDQPEDFDAAAHVLTGLAQAPWAYDVALRVQASPDRIRSRFPEGIATVEEIRPTPPTSTQPEDQADSTGREAWFRVRIRAERLEWIAPLLAALDCPFVIEQPSELRGLVDDLAQRLTRYATGKDEPR